MAVHRGRIDHCLFFKDTSVAVVGAVSAHCPDRDLLQQGTKLLSAVFLLPYTVLGDGDMEMN